MSLARNKREIADLKKQVASLRPVRTANLLTSRTTNGLSVRPISTSESQTSNRTNNTARWA